MRCNCVLWDCRPITFTLSITVTFWQQWQMSQRYSYGKGKRYTVTHGAYLHCLLVYTVWWKLVRWQLERSSRCNPTKDLLLMKYSISALVPVGASCHSPTVNSSIIKGQNPWHQFPLSKSPTSPQYKRHVRNKLARSKVHCVCCVVSFPKFHYYDLLRTCWPCR